MYRYLNVATTGSKDAQFGPANSLCNPKTLKLSVAELTKVHRS